MEIQYFGGNCVKISSKKANVIIDDNLKDLELSSATKAGDIRLSTKAGEDKMEEGIFSFSQPGEYEVSDLSITGIAAQAHIDDPGTLNATMYRIVADDVRVAIVGHIDPKLSEQQLEALGTIDVLIVPVGGNGFTLDAIGAQQVIKAIEPKIIIPTNYDDSKITYEVPAAKLEDALKTMGLEAKETVSKLKIKGTELLTDQAQVIVVERT